MSSVLKCFLFADFPLPGLVHDYVTSWTLQQFLLCLSSGGHRNGCQDPAYNSFFGHTQWKTGTFSSKAQTVSENLYLQWEKNNFIPCWFCTFAHWQRNDQSIILMVGFLWTVRDRITATKKSRKVFDPFAKLDLVLGAKTLVGNHRGQTFLVVGHQVFTHLRRDFVPLLFADPLQVIKVSRLTFGNSNLQLPPQIFRLARPLQDLNVLLLEPLLCCLGCVFWVVVMLEYLSTTHFQCPG